MQLRLTIYTNDELNEVNRIAEADSVKIPYRVAKYIIKSLDTLEETGSDDDLISFICKNTDMLDKILKATFDIRELELDCINSVELLNVINSLYVWGFELMNGLKSNNSKNVVAPVTI